MAQVIWIGVDIGTTGVRAVAYRPNGQSVASAAKTYPLHTPRPEWAEQDPNEIVKATERVILSVSESLMRNGKKASGLALSTVFHSFLAYDRTLRPVSTLMTWADNRSSDVVRDMKRTEDCLAIYQRTGCPVHPMYPMSKIAWMRGNRPELYKQTKFFGSIKDYLFKTLTGEWVVDRSIASGSGLYNSSALRWDAALLNYFDITESSMPRVVSTTYRRPLSPEAAARLGMASGTPVVIGAGDGVLVNVGIGAVKPGQASATIGTSGAVRTVSDGPRVDEKGRTWCYNLTDDVWVSGGAINNGGLCLRWVRDQFCREDEKSAEQLGVDVYDLMTLQAEKIAAGSDGLLLLPFFTGERAPNWNADIRATFFGLTLNHGKGHFIRATMEGVCFRMNSILEALEEVMGPVEDIRVSGSFTHSKLWLQILADVFNKNVGMASVDEGAAFGAAALGFISDGVYENIASTADFVTVDRLYRPRAENAETYRYLYGIYNRVYWNLQREFSDITAFQHRH